MVSGGREALGADAGVMAVGEQEVICSGTYTSAYVECKAHQGNKGMWLVKVSGLMIPKRDIW